jgi:DNA-binding MarR family transcriptional regulator
MLSTENLLETYATIRRRLSVEASGLLKDTGLGHRQFIILKALADNGEVNVTDLAAYCMTDPGTVSRSIDQLRKCGLVDKVQSKQDGRVWMIRLTKRGQEKIPKVSSVYSELSRRCFGHLNTEQKADLGALLHQVAEKLERK